MQQSDIPPDNNDISQAISNATNAAIRNDWQQVQEYLQPHEGELRQHPQACYLVGVKLIKEQMRDMGVAWLERAIELQPKHVGALYALGYQLFNMRKFDAASKYLKKVTQIKDSNVLAWVYLAHSYVESGIGCKAVEAYLRVKELDAGFPRLDYYLANAYLFFGERDKALTHIDTALQLDARDVSAVWKYVIINNYKVGEARLREFEALFEELQAEGNTSDDLAYALAGIYEKRGDVEHACDYFEKANAIRAEKEPFDRPKLVELIQNLREQVADWGARDWSGHGAHDKGAVFIVGMPRSGTTLLQQILGAHSHITPAGELRILKQIFYDIAPPQMHKPFPHLLAQMTPQISKEFGEYYLHELRKHGDTSLLIDKMPSNFFYIPMIKMILPQAIILHLTRDPIDVCWSMWRQGFEPGHSYSYDFKSLADYYADSMELIDFYKKVAPGFVHEVSYEELVAKPKSEAQRLISLCGLKWEDSVMDYHKQKQQIRTSSVNQANQPVYKTSQRAWEPVKHRIRPLIDALHARGVETCISRGEVRL